MIQYKRGILKKLCLKNSMPNDLKSHLKRPFKSNIHLAKAICDQKRIARSPANPSFLTRVNRHRRRVHEPIDTLDDVVLFDEDASPSSPEEISTLAPDSLLQFFNQLQLHAQMREIAQENVRRIYALEMSYSILKAADSTFARNSDWFRVHEGRSKKNLLLRGNVVAVLAPKEALGGVIDQSIKKMVSVLLFRGCFFPNNTKTSSLRTPSCKVHL